MNIKRIICLLAISLLLLASTNQAYANDDEYYLPGLLFGKPFSGNIFALTDGNRTTSYSGYGNTNFIFYTFEEPVDIQTIFYHYTVQQNLSNLRMYDDQGTEIYNLTMQRGQPYLSVNLTNVKQIRIYHPRGFSATYYAFEVYGDSAAIPSVPAGLRATSQVGQVTLNWNEQSVFGFNVYRNGVKLNDSPIRTNTFVDDTGEPDVMYSYQVSAVNSFGGESPKSSVVNASSLLPLIAPTVTYKNLTDTSVTLEWDNVGNNFTILQDGEVIATNRMFKFYNVDGLTPNTEYEFIVRLVDRYGRTIDSDPLTIRTHRMKLPSPVISFSDITHNSFTVSWQPIQIATGYRVFVNGEEQSFTGTSLTYTNAEPDTIYNVRVEAYNDDDTSSTTLSTRTTRQPVPRINHASVTPSTGTGGTPPSPTMRNLQYEPNELVTAVRVYINGELIGEFPSDVREIEIDFADIQDALMADITIEPVDENGIPYNFKTPVTTTGNEAIDRIVGSLLGVWEIMRKSFLWMVLLGALVLTILVVLFFWLRRKYQGFFGKHKNFRGEMKSTKGAVYRASDKAKFDPPAFTPPKGGAKYKKTRAPTRRANIQRTPKQLQEKDKRYYQSFNQSFNGRTHNQTQQFTQKVVNFNDQNQVIAFQERAQNFMNKRRNRK